MHVPVSFHLSGTHVLSSQYSTLHHETFQRHHQRRHPSFIGKSTHLLAHARFLERPQGAQRRLFCCAETPDARDIESLVGSIPPQRLELLTTLEIPEHYGPVIPATGQQAFIGARLERVHRSLMCLSHPQKATRLSPLTSLARLLLNLTHFSLLLNCGPLLFEKIVG
jgi:hypothetical protein